MKQITLEEAQLLFDLGVALYYKVRGLPGRWFLDSGLERPLEAERNCFIWGVPEE